MLQQNFKINLSIMLQQILYIYICIKLEVEKRIKKKCLNNKKYQKYPSTRDWIVIEGYPRVIVV